MDNRLNSASELEHLRRENERLRAELAAAGRTAVRRDEAQAAADLRYAGRLAATEARSLAAEVDARAAWARAAELGTSLGRRIAEGQAQLIASQAAVASLERANEGLAAGQAAIALREADLRAVIESAIDCAIVTTDRDGFVLAWNSGARRLLGWDEADALTMDLGAVLPPEERERGALAADIAAALSGTRISREGWLLRQDGSRVWASIEAMAVRADGIDAPVGVLWMLRDCSAARQKEAALRESEARYRLLQAVWETDGDGVVVADSPSWRAYTGQTLEQWLGYGWLDALHPDDRAYAERQWREAIAAHRLVDAEFRLRAPGGGWRWTNVRAAPMTDADGRIEKWLGLNIDIDDRKRAEAALREREERLSNVLAGMTEGFGLLAPDFTILEHNREALRMDGRPRDEIVGRSHWEVYHGTEDSELGRLLQHAMTARVPVTLEHRYGFANGQALWLEMRAYPTPDEALAVFWRDVTDRKTAEAALREREERLRKVLDIETVGVVFFDLVGGIHGANDAFLAMIGYSRADLEAGEVRYERLTPLEWRWRDEKTIEELRATGRSGPFEKEYTRRDGSRIWILCTSTMVDGETAAEFIIDVTERRRAEDALRASEERYRTLFTSIDSGFCVAELRFDAPGDRTDYRIVEANPAFHRHTGLPEAILGRWMREATPALEEHWYETYGRVALTGEPARFEEGSALLGRWFDVYAFRIGEPEQRRVAILFDDVSARRAAEARLRELNETLEQQVVERTAERDRMWDSSPDLMLVVDFEGYFRRVNPAWTALLGYDPEELVGHHVNEFVVPDDHEATVGAYELAAAGGRPKIVNRYRHKDGSTRWIAWVGAPAAGMTYATGRDITREKEREAELAQAQEALRQSQKLEAIGQLTGGIAHDFNNMLQGVAGGLDMARRRMDAGRLDEAGRYIDAARDATARAAGLTRRLLAFARRQRLEPQTIDPAALMRGMADMLRRTMGPAITMDLDLADGAGLVACDPNELESALLNLCINARDAMPEAGRLILSTHGRGLSATELKGFPDASPGPHVEITVADTGSGMPPEVLEHVLEPFFTTKPLGRGTGLGLSQVYGFVRQSGGALRIESGPGQGTAIRLWLPVAPQRVLTKGAPAAVAAAAHEGEGAVLLMVDDEAGVREPAAARLRDLGYEVIEAPDGPSGLRLLKEGLRPALLVTDVGLPGGMDGARVAEAARHLIPGLPVLFMTGYATASLPLDAEVLGKPFTLDALTARVRSVLAAPSSRNLP